ncbi:hypothetical protein [Streptomyces dysideae]|uniref:hypothetical protein n=1 Tax=Streptomyces dysideae TaxID=909626 RepID=UPI000ACDF90A|nr:hypothetical protein [Streptomyces dysideae]
MGAFFLAVGVWFLANATKPQVLNAMRSMSGASPRGEKKTRILSRLLGVVFTAAGTGAVIGGCVLAIRS